MEAATFRPWTRLKQWQTGLKGVPHVRVETIVGLNHAFMAGTGKANSREEIMTTGHVDSRVINAIAAFIENPLAR